MNHYLAIDIGGSSIKYGIVTVDGSAVTMGTAGKVPIPDALAGLTETVSGLVESHSDTEITGIAVSMPGLIDSANGTAVHGGALTYIRNCPIQSVLQGELDIPLTVENDGKCAALGESWVGELQQAENGIVLVLGTGIGGGIISNGKLLRGTHLCAGEFSAIQTCNDRDLKDNSFAAQNGLGLLMNRYQAASGEANVDGTVFFDRVEQGEEQARKIFREYCRKIAFQIVNLQNILDPEKFIVSGGISARPVVAEYISEAVKTLRQDMIRDSGIYFPEPVVLRSELGNRANLYGAVKNLLNS